MCPVVLSKPGLGYKPEENKIGARIRDWVVGVPDLGFLFPALVFSAIVKRAYGADEEQSKEALIGIQESS